MINSVLQEEKINQNLAGISRALKPVFQKHRVQKAIVFGSYARGVSTRKSDLDMVLIKNTSRNFFDRYKGVYLDICEKVRGAAIDLLIYTPRELENIMHRKFIRKIINEGVTIYERREKHTRS